MDRICVFFLRVAVVSYQLPDTKGNELLPGQKQITKKRDVGIAGESRSKQARPGKLKAACFCIMKSKGCEDKDKCNQGGSLS